MSIYFAHKTWVEIEEYAQNNTLIILPVGTVEEHGKHLPVETDAKIAEGIGKAIAEDIKDEISVLVMPAIWTGYSPKEMLKWPGTMRVRPRVFTDMVYDVCASIAEMGFKKIMMLDCHGQHASMLNVATKEIADSYGIYITVTSPLTFSAKEFNEVRKSESGGVLHACEWETSMMLYLTDRVKMEYATDEDIMRYHSKFVSGDGALGGQKVVWSTWGLQKSRTGVYGDPTVATREMGEFIMKALLKNYREFIFEYMNFKDEA